MPLHPGIKPLFHDRLGMLCAASGLAAVLAGFAPPSATRAALYVDHALALVLLNLLLAAAAGIWLLCEFRAAEPARTPAIAWLSAAALAVLTVLWLRSLLPVQPRIELDETQLLGVSWSLWLDHTPVVISSGYIDAHGGIAPLTVAADKRGLLFPVLIWCLHLLRGYGAGNPLSLNVACSAVALIGSFALARQLGLSIVAAISGMLLLAASPLLASTAASGGFEPLNLALLALGSALALYAARTRSRAAVTMLLLLAPLLAQCRYEAVVVSGTLFAIACWLSRSLSAPAPRIAAVIAPFLYLPLAWHYGITIDHDLQQIGASSAFSLTALAGNLWHLLQALGIVALNPLHLALPAASLLLLLPAAGAKAPAVPAAVPRLVLLSWALMMGVILSYAWGDLRRSETARLALPLTLLLCIGASAGLGRVARRLLPGRGDWLASLAPASALMAAAHFVPGDVIGQRQILAPGLNATARWLATRAPACRPLLITPYSAYFLARGYSGLTQQQLAAQSAAVESRLASSDLDLLIAPVITNRISGTTLSGQQLPGDRLARIIHSEHAGPASELDIAALASGREPPERCAGLLDATGVSR
jgi:hypothetical protein